MADVVMIELTPDQALVLYEWLARAERTGPVVIEHNAERQVLWDIEASLEKILSETFSDDYQERVEAARLRVASD